jgi:hypothetical protein
LPRPLIIHSRFLRVNRLSKALLAGKEFSRVVLYDIQAPSEELLPGEQYVQGATQDQQCFQECLMKHSPVSVVFHVAAYGISGAASLDKKKTWEVNVVVSSGTNSSSRQSAADTLTKPACLACHQSLDQTRGCSMAVHVCSR